MYILILIRHSYKGWRTIMHTSGFDPETATIASRQVKGLWPLTKKGVKGWYQRFKKCSHRRREVLLLVLKVYYEGPTNQPTNWPTTKMFLSYRHFQPIYEHYMYVFLWLAIRLDNIRIPSLFSFFTNSLPNSRVHLTSPLPTTVPHLFPWWHLNIHTQYPTIIHTFKGHFSQKMGLGPFFSSVIINFKTW